jgi:hypothetical protein
LSFPSQRKEVTFGTPSLFLFSKLSIYVNQLSVAWDKIPEKTQLIRRKDLFWLTISEVLVHGHLALLALDL